MNTHVLYIQAYTHTYVTHTYIYICIKYTCIYIHIHVYYIYIYTYAYLYIHVYLYIYIYNVRVCVYIIMCIYIVINEKVNIGRYSCSCSWQHFGIGRESPCPKKATSTILRQLGMRPHKMADHLLLARCQRASGANQSASVAMNGCARVPPVGRCVEASFPRFLPSSVVKPGWRGGTLPQGVASL